MLRSRVEGFLEGAFKERARGFERRGGFGGDTPERLKGTGCSR